MYPIETRAVPLGAQTPHQHEQRDLWSQGGTCAATCFAVSMGMAKETPSAVSAFIEEMPTTSPARLTSGPPEFPEFIAASVWMKSVFGPANPSSTACTADSMYHFGAPHHVWSQQGSMLPTLLQVPQPAEVKILAATPKYVVSRRADDCSI